MIQVRGPECPRCGCRDSEVAAVVDTFGNKAERRACRHCGRRFVRSINPAKPSDVPKVVDEPAPRRCPNCGAAGRRIKVTGTREPLRSLKCRDCGFPYQEVMHACKCDARLQILNFWMRKHHVKKRLSCGQPENPRNRIEPVAMDRH